MISTFKITPLLSYMKHWKCTSWVLYNNQFSSPRDLAGRSPISDIKCLVMTVTCQRYVGRQSWEATPWDKNWVHCSAMSEDRVGPEPLSGHSLVEPSPAHGHGTAEHRALLQGEAVQAKYLKYLQGCLWTYLQSCCKAKLIPGGREDG